MNRTRYEKQVPAWLMSMIVLLAAAVPDVAGQSCQPQWSAQFADGAGLGSTGGVGPRAFTLFDADAAGPGPPALVVAGAFGTAGGISTGNVALWSGSSWSGLGGGVGGLVHDAVVFDDDGPGPNPPRLHVCGYFFPPLQSPNRIARWNEAASAWETVGGGLGNTPFALAVFDEDGDGPGLPALFVGGEFTSAGGVTVNRLARWNGAAWSNAGAGLPSSIQVKELYVFDDDGNGPHAPVLLAGTDVGGGGVYRRDGQGWTFIGGFVGGGVRALTSVDHDGAGPNPPTLYAGGNFVYHEYPNAVNYVARYVAGTAWAPMAQGVLGNVSSLTSFDDDGAGPDLPALYVAGEFLTASAVSVNHIAKWDGQSWSALAGGLTPTYAGVQVGALGVFDPDGPGPHAADFYAGGFFSAAGGLSSFNIAAWLGCASPGMPGDLDGDGDLDLDDHAAFAACLSGPEHAPPAGCQPADLQGDDDVDLADFTDFQAAFTGS